MPSMTPARDTSVGLRRRLTAVVVATLAMLAAAPPAVSAWNTAAALVALAACAVALCDEVSWRRLVLVAVVVRPGRGRHRASVVLPLQRRASTSASPSVVDTTLGGTR